MGCSYKCSLMGLKSAVKAPAAFWSKRSLLLEQFELRSLLLETVEAAGTYWSKKTFSLAVKTSGVYPSDFLRLFPELPGRWPTAAEW